jgi:hypothetical protein
MSTKVRVSIEGLAAVVPTKKNQAHIVLPNGWKPRKASPRREEIVPSHCAYVSYDPSTADKQSEVPHVIVPGRAGSPGRAFHLLNGMVIILDGQEGSSLKLDGVKRSVAEIEEISKRSGKIRPKALKGTSADPKIVAGTTLLGAGTLAAVVGKRKWKYKGKKVQLAEKLLLEYEIPSSRLTIGLAGMNGADPPDTEETIVLKARNGVIDVTIGNDPLGELIGRGGRGGHGGHPSHRHFEIYYDLSGNGRPTKRPYPVLEPAAAIMPMTPHGYCGPPVLFEEP